MTKHVEKIMVKNPMNSTILSIRGLNYHIQEWGDSTKPVLFLLHGWMDCGASFKYMVEYLTEDYYVVAPDWRGFGESEHASPYWFPDYFADLDKILDHYTPNHPANIVGHSMGGNIALMFAGIQADRVNRVMSLEALGMPPTEPTEAPKKYRRWIREINSDEPAKIYPSFDVLCSSVHKGNPQLSQETIIDLAKIWGKPVGQSGAYQLKHDHAHRYANPVRYNFDEVLACWQEITAKVGLVMACNSSFYKQLHKTGRIEESKKVLSVADNDYFEIDDCGHMMHIEQPEQTAKTILRFFKR